MCARVILLQSWESIFLTHVLEIQLCSSWDRLAIESLQYQSDSFSGCVWVVTRVHGEDLDDDIFLACDDGYAVRKGAAAVYEMRGLGDRAVHAM